MKRLLSLLPAMLLVLFVACGGDDNPYNINPKNPIPVETDPGQANGPEIAKYSLEFPQMKGGKSEIIVHEAEINSTTKKRAINYSLEWDHDKKATRWVCYKMYLDTNTSAWNRNNWPNGDPWAYDPSVPQSEQQATYNELSKSNPPLSNSTYYEKGHILASADRLCSQEANGQTFYMTNIYPMVKNFNGGVWATLEGRVRGWANASDTLYVVKGGTIDNEKNILARTIGNHIVPKYFYMALMSKKGNNLRAIGFFLEHKDDTSWGKLKDYAYSIKELENKTGINFFCNLPDDTEIQIENPDRTQMLKDWSLNN
ncbi:MAG: DNA/RNA non-specific endonuclease [Prevotella sp.]|nr:DNA/RNA non-specific endonuclease [Prevotella sp.]